jgi:tetratricopeptide (TPR) repeat protein
MDFLKKAETIAWNRPKFLAITFNNFACFYRKYIHPDICLPVTLCRKGKFRVSLNYLEQALRIEKNLDDQKDLAETHLNICAILSKLGQHADALEHVLTAIMLIQDDIIVHSDDEPKRLKEKRSGLIVAYHNLGVEYEYLKRVSSVLPLDLIPAIV